MYPLVQKPLDSFNRTIVELRQLTIMSFNEILLSFNRTIVELRLIFYANLYHV